MKKLAAALAAAVAMVALAALSGVALAGAHGNGNGNGNGNSPTASSDQQAGVKPGNDTKKDQTCTTGGGQGSSATCSSSTYPGKSDSSKRYGNGKTAAQIANGKGAPSGTPVYGPGNSQPHKICGRDVHAYKGGDCAKQKPPKTQTTTATTTTTAAQVQVAPPATTTTVATTTTTTKTAAVTTTTTAAAASLGSSTPAPPPSPSAQSGVLGATKSLSAPASTPTRAPAGVLGTLKTLGTGTLPFTGLRLWIFELIALGLIGAGVATRLIARRRPN
jgi:hypothetical protein